MVPGDVREENAITAGAFAEGLDQIGREGFLGIPSRSTGPLLQLLRPDPENFEAIGLAQLSEEQRLKGFLRGNAHGTQVGIAERKDSHTSEGGRQSGVLFVNIAGHIAGADDHVFEGIGGRTPRKAKNESRAVEEAPKRGPPAQLKKFR